MDKDSSKDLSPASVRRKDRAARLRWYEAQRMRLGRILEESLNEIYFFDAETLRFSYANRGARRNLGYSMAELQSLTPLDIKPEFTPESYGALIQPLRNDAGRFLQCETIHRRKDGSTYPVEVHLQCIADEGTPVFAAIILDISQRRAAEDALRQSEARYHQIVEAANEGVWAMDANYCTTFVNQKMQEMLGYSEAEMIGRPVNDFMHPDQQDAHHAQMAARRHGDSSVYERCFRRKDGSDCWAIVAAVPWMDTSGVFAGAFAMLTDITGHKKLEGDLQRSLYSLDQISEALYWTHSDARFFNVNQAACWALGYTREELLGMTVYDIDPGYNPEEFSPFLEKLRTRGALTVETRHRRKDGRFFPVSLSANHVIFEGIEYIFAFARDITARRQVEKELEESRKFTDTILACVGEGIIVYDRSLRYRVWNDQLERMTGVPAEDVLGKLPLELFPYLKEYGLEGMLQRALAGETVQSHEVNYQMPMTGKSGWSVSTYSPLRSTDGEIIGVVVSVHDITRYKQMQSAMMEREKMASLGTLAAGVAHEVNTPLQIITGASENLLRDVQGGKLDAIRLERNLKHIHDNAWRVARIVGALQTYSLPVAPTLQPGSLNEMAHEAILLVENRIKGASIQRQMFLGENLPDMDCDRGQVTQALVLLLNNAIDAMPRGGLLTVSSGLIQDNGGLFIKISDSGIGIPTHMLQWVFDPFFTTKPLGKGEGLGLCLVQSIASAHGGRVEVESRSGEGSAFTMLFPFHPPPVSGSPLAGRFGDR